MRGIRQTVISLGRGIEIETLHLAFEKFKNASSSWFLPHANDYCSVAISQPLLSNLVHQERLINLGILGALTGLMVIYGLAPAPFGPGLLQFLLHDCDLRALTPAFLSEWYPDLHHTLQEWTPQATTWPPFILTLPYIMMRR